ncbi:MAG: protein kinase domain-containing protein, partial [Gemmata sp.]
MPRLHSLLECLGQALCEKGRKALQGQWPFNEALPDIARAAADLAHHKLPGPDLRAAITDCAAVAPAEWERRLSELVAELATTFVVPKVELVDYLRALPVTVRQILRRPSDPNGHSVPESLYFTRPEDFALILPPRVPRFRPGDRPTGLDNWTLTELRGLGQNSEVWRGEDREKPDAPDAALKFVIEPEAQERVRAGTELFTKVFDLNDVAGVLPLRSVYLETDPPCLEAPFVTGYDLAGLMFDWRHRYDTAKPEAALKLVRRLASVVSKAHDKGVVHCDLKPSNILLHPTEGGKFTLWVSDFGWGQIEGARALELVKSSARGEQQRLAQRGAATSLYASPQRAKKEPPVPGDDVHAIGVIWYQLLKRDPAAAAPFGTDWVDEFRSAGFTDSQARVLQACLNTRADKRPKNAAALAEQLATVTVAPPDPAGSDGSKLLALNSPSTSHHAPQPPGAASAPHATVRGKDYSGEAAAGAASALLAAAGG